MTDKYVFSNIFGTFLFGKDLTILAKKEIRQDEAIRLMQGGVLLAEEEFLAKNPEAKLIGFKKGQEIKTSKDTDKEITQKILNYFKSPQYFPEFYKKNLELTKARIKNSIEPDTFIVQAVNNIQETEKIINTMAKRLREWYSYYNPEFEAAEKDHYIFADKILKKERKELLKEIGLMEKQSMGADLTKEETEPMLKLAKQIISLSELKEQQLSYLEGAMKQNCTNINEVAGTIVGAKLIAAAGSLQKLAGMTSSTIQLLGAEKALFRHMRNKKNLPPKHGILLQHTLFANAAKKDHGKIARALANKIAIAARIDYFRGSFAGDKLRKELEQRFR